MYMVGSEIQQYDGQDYFFQILYLFELPDLVRIIPNRSIIISCLIHINIDHVTNYYYFDFKAPIQIICRLMFAILSSSLTKVTLSFFNSFKIYLFMIIAIVHRLK